DLQEARDGLGMNGQRRRAEYDGMAAPLVRLHDLAHERKDTRRNAFDEQSLAQLVQFGQRFTTQVTRSPCEQMLEPHPAQPVPHRSLDDTQHLADPRLPAPDAVARMGSGSESVHERAIEIEEGPDLRAGRAHADLGDLVCGGRLDGHREQAYFAVYKPCPVTSGISSVVRMPAGAATTSGMAFTIRPAAARIAA